MASRAESNPSHTEGSRVLSQQSNPAKTLNAFMVGNLNYSQHTAEHSLPWLWALSGGESKRISRLVSRSSRATWHAVSGLSPVIIASWEMKKKPILDIMFYQYFCHFHFPFISFFFISFYFNDATMLRAQLRENRSTKCIIDKSLRSNYLESTC